MVVENWTTTFKRMKLNHCLKPYTKNYSKYILVCISAQDCNIFKDNDTVDHMSQEPVEIRISIQEDLFS